MDATMPNPAYGHDAECQGVNIDLEAPGTIARPPRGNKELFSRDYSHTRPDERVHLLRSRRVAGNSKVKAPKDHCRLRPHLSQMAMQSPRRMGPVTHFPWWLHELHPSGADIVCPPAIGKHSRSDQFSWRDYQEYFPQTHPAPRPLSLAHPVFSS